MLGEGRTPPERGLTVRGGGGTGVCNPETADNCNTAALQVLTDEYLARPELYVIYLDHSMDIRVRA